MALLMPGPGHSASSIRRRDLRALLIVALAAAVFACGAPAHRVEPERIVLVTIDTLRADHLPFFGYPIDTA
ncbi:MAG: hypothetical protein QGG24_01555, partial [Vicinamibacterales bacterium]|nr:hypothetical protein [Vicinamibacterales bacterium]